MCYKEVCLSWCNQCPQNLSNYSISNIPVRSLWLLLTALSIHLLLLFRLLALGWTGGPLTRGRDRSTTVAAHWWCSALLGWTGSRLALQNKYSRLCMCSLYQTNLLCSKYSDNWLQLMWSNNLAHNNAFFTNEKKKELYDKLMHRKHNSRFIWEEESQILSFFHSKWNLLH